MSTQRAYSFDTLRGFAIAVMALDHFCAIVLLQGIEPVNLRFLARIAEPLFAVLFGYFLVGRDRNRIFGRVEQVLWAAVAVNAFFFAAFGSYEILVTFLLLFVLYALFEEHLVYLLPLFLLHQFDVTAKYLDYPLFIVTSQVAMGMLLRRGGPVWACLIFGLAWFTMPAPTSYVGIFTIAAAGLVKLAEHEPGFEVPGLTDIGMRPLSTYIGQWAAVVGFAIVWGFMGGQSAWLLQKLGSSYGKLLGG